MTRSVDDRLRDPVRQSSAMIAAQLHGARGEGVGRLEIPADATRRTLDDMTLDVLYRLVRFDA